MKHSRSQTYPTSKQRTGVVFFLCAHDTKLKYYKFAITQLLKRGYDIVGYEFDPAVVHAGDPSLVITLIQDMREEIERVLASDYADTSVEVGLFGNSIGTFIAYNILDIPRVDWVIMNTGGNLAQGFWMLPRARRGFEAKGVSLKQLEQAWHAVQSPGWNNPKDKRVLLLAGTADKLATPEDALTAHEYMLSHGVNSKFIKIRRLNHQSTLLYNLGRIGWLLKNLPPNTP